MSRLFWYFADLARATRGDPGACACAWVRGASSRRRPAYLFALSQSSGDRNGLTAKGYFGFRPLGWPGKGELRRRSHTTRPKPCYNAKAHSGRPETAPPSASSQPTAAFHVGLQGCYMKLRESVCLIFIRNLSPLTPAAC